MDSMVLPSGVTKRYSIKITNELPINIYGLSPICNECGNGEDVCEWAKCSRKKPISKLSLDLTA